MEDEIKLKFCVAKLLLWLDGFDCTDKHESTLRQRQQTTGDWLFKERLYTDWRNGSIDFIWLHGKRMSLTIQENSKLTVDIAGAGKSVLAYGVLYIRLRSSFSLVADPPLLIIFQTDLRTTRHWRISTATFETAAVRAPWKSYAQWPNSFYGTQKVIGFLRFPT